MNERKFFINLLSLLGVAMIFTVLDVITGNETELSTTLTCAFFIVWNTNVWNTNVCSIKKH